MFIGQIKKKKTANVRVFEAFALRNPDRHVMNLFSFMCIAYCLNIRSSIFLIQTDPSV